MSRLLLYSLLNPLAKENFKKNVEDGISFDQISNKNFGDINISAYKERDKLFFWACKDSKYYDRRFKNISNGDIIMFAEKKVFIKMATVEKKIKKESLSNLLFNDNVFSNILLLKDLKDIHIPYNFIFNDLGYDSKAKLHGLILVDPIRTGKLIKDNGSLKNYITNITKSNSINLSRAT